MSTNLARRNLILYLFHYGTRFLSPVIVAPYLARTLGTSAFADYVVWNAAMWTAVLLMEFGFYIYAINATATAEGHDELGAVVSSILTAKAMLAPVAVSGFLIGTYVIGLATRQPLAVGIGLWTVFINGMTLGWYFQGLQRGATAVLLEAVPQFSQLLLVLVLVNAPDEMWRVAVLQTIAATITTMLGWMLLRRNKLQLRLRWRSAMLSARAAVPYFVERVSFTLYSTTTPILISVLSTAHQAAFYGLAEKVNLVLTALVFAATPAIAPVIARRARQTPPDWALSIKVVLGVTAVVIAAAVFMVAAIGPLVEYFLGPDYAEAIPIARWFCLIGVLMTFQLSLSNFVVLPGGNAKLLVRTSSIALVITLGLQVLLVHRYGALGSVIARACAEFAIGAILLVAALRIVRNRVPAKPLDLSDQASEF